MTGRPDHTARFERHTRTSDGVDLFWFDYGRQDARPLALVHGLAAGADQFDADARFFAHEGFRVIAPDLRGHGRSGKAPAGAPEGYTISRMARDLLEIFDDAQTGPLDYVGNSLGGILALHLAKDHGHRFRSLTTFGTAPALRLPKATGALIPLSYRIAGRGLTARLTAHTTTPNKDARPIVEKLVRDFDPAVGEAVARAVSRYDLLGNAMGYAGPWLIVRGALDRAVNTALDPALKKLEHKRNVAIVRMPGAGHCANLDQPDLFRQTLLRFLLAVSSQRTEAGGHDDDNDTSSPGTGMVRRPAGR